MTHFQQTVAEAIIRGGMHYYLFPTTAWAVRAIWDNRFEIGGRMRTFVEWCIPDGIPYTPNKKEYSITFNHNNAMIRFGGTDDLGFVGQGGASYTLSEYSLHKKEVTGYLMPIIRQANAPLRMNGTLRGRDNHLWEMLEANKNHPEWFVQWLRPNETKCYCWCDDEFQINPELMSRIGERGPNGTPIFNVADDIRSGSISHAFAMQEYLNEPILASEHGYFTREYLLAKGEGRVLNDEVKYNPKLPVFTFWDLGKGTSDKSTDSMVVWFIQFPDEDYPKPKKAHIIDCHSSIGEDWAFYASMLAKKGYWYGAHFAPWDIQSGKAGWGAKTNLDLARERGIDFIPVKRTPAVSVDIELLRRHFVNLWFANIRDVEKGAEMLASYHQKLTSDNVPTGKPEHDQCFTGDTLIWMEDNSQKRIDAVVAGEYVRMSYNHIARVEKAWLVDSNATVLEIELSDGKKIKCTGSHKIFTNKGLVRADALRYGDVIATKENKLWQHLLNRLVPLAESVSLSIMEQDTGYGKKEGSIVHKLEESKRFFTTFFTEIKSIALIKIAKIYVRKIGAKTLDIPSFHQKIENLLSLMGKHFIKKKQDTGYQSHMAYCIDMYGDFSTEKSQKDMQCTTKMKIKTIIANRILNCFNYLSTQSYIQKQMHGLAQMKIKCNSIVLKKKLNYGTKPIAVLHCIKKMGGNYGNQSLSLKKRVLCVAKNIKHIFQKEQNTVDTYVKAVTYIEGAHKVYHLRIDPYEAYYANGILVKNSSNFADAMRNFIRAWDFDMINPRNMRSNGFEWTKDLKLTGYFD